MSKFKVGDKVRIKEGTDYYHAHKIGSIGEVAEYTGEGWYDVYAESANTDNMYYQEHPGDALELVIPPLIDDEGEPVKDGLDTYMVRIGNGFITLSWKFVLPGMTAITDGAMTYDQAENIAIKTGGEVVALTTVPVVEE